MFLPIITVEAVNNDTATAAGVDELAVFQEYAHVSALFSGTGSTEKHEIALLQGSFAPYLLAVFRVLVVAASRKAFMIDFPVNLPCQTGTIDAAL